jgi:hypothetical protein
VGPESSIARASHVQRHQFVFPFSSCAILPSRANAAASHSCRPRPRDREVPRNSNSNGLLEWCERGGLRLMPVGRTPPPIRVRKDGHYIYFTAAGQRRHQSIPRSILPRNNAPADVSRRRQALSRDRSIRPCLRRVPAARQQAGASGRGQRRVVVLLLIIVAGGGDGVSRCDSSVRWGRS